MAATKRSYLKLIGNTWAAYIKVPAGLVDHYGKRHLVRSLKTQDLETASLRRDAVIAEWRREFAKLKKTDPAAREAASIRQQIRDAVTDSNAETIDLLEVVAHDRMEQMIEAGESPKKASAWYSLATARVETLSELQDKWLDGAQVTARTRVQYRKALVEFLEYMKAQGHPDPLPGDVTRQTANGFVFDYLKGSGQRYATQRRKVNSLVNLWDWLGRYEHVPAGFNPFRGFKLKRSAIDGDAEAKRAYTMAELVALFAQRPPYPGVPDLMVLGLLTGARLEALAARKVADLSWREDGLARLRITGDKTDAGDRTIVLAHPFALAILKRRSNGRAPVAYLFDEISGYGDKRSANASKHFGRFRRKVLGKSSAVDFHSFRRTLATLMENLRIDPLAASRYIGHKPSGMTFGLYSAGATEETMAEVAKGIRYPADVESAVGRFLEGAASV